MGVPISFALLSFLTPGITVAYVTHEDMCHIKAFQEQTLIAVRAPEETKLDVPLPREVSCGWA